MSGFFIAQMSNWYANLLTDPRWLKLRKERLAIDRYKCQSCGKGYPAVSLAVHHIGYVTGWMPWDYPLSMLQTLCFAHHEEQHAGQRPIYAQCHCCKKIVSEADIMGRFEKHEWICGKCVDEMEVKCYG